ncbi:hypothetical protein BDR06DRAFT_1014324 [Suillus hirtellus]|nr:hypothetical protein BDR06DRAFT_1014324 [Suillus hirtellus]
MSMAATSLHAQAEHPWTRQRNYGTSKLINLMESCSSLYTWDLTTIVNKIADATLQPAPKMNGAARIGFFDDTLREADLHTGLSQFHGPTLAPSQTTLSRLSTFWRLFKPHGATESDTQSRPQSLSWN